MKTYYERVLNIFERKILIGIFGATKSGGQGTATSYILSL